MKHKKKKSKSKSKDGLGLSGDSVKKMKKKKKKSKHKTKQHSLGIASLSNRSTGKTLNASLMHNLTIGDCVGNTTEEIFNLQSKLDEIRSGLQPHLDEKTSNEVMTQIASLLPTSPQPSASHKKKHNSNKSKHESKDKVKKKNKNKKHSNKKNSEKTGKHKTTESNKNTGSETFVKENNEKTSVLVNSQAIQQGINSCEVYHLPKQSSVKSSTPVISTKRLLTHKKTKQSNSLQIKNIINRAPARSSSKVVNNQIKLTETTATTNRSQLSNKQTVSNKELMTQVNQNIDLSCSFDDESDIDAIHPAIFKNIMKDIDETTLPNLNSVSSTTPVANEIENTHKKAIDSQCNEHKAIADGYNNTERLENKSNDITVERSSLLKKKKTKRKKRSENTDEGVSVGQDITKDNVNVVEELVLKDNEVEIKEEETSILRKKKKRKRKQLIINAPEEEKVDPENISNAEYCVEIEEMFDVFDIVDNEDQVYVDEIASSVCDSPNTNSKSNCSDLTEQTLVNLGFNIEEVTEHNVNEVQEPSVDASPRNENKNNNEENLANYVEEEAMEGKQTDIGDDETHHSRKRKKNKHKRSVDSSPGNENENNNEESFANYLEEEVMEYKQTHIGDDETIRSRKKKKKKHKRSVVASPGNENKEEEVMEEKQTDIEVEETRHSRKSKKKKHKRSVDASPGNENKNNNEESLAYYVEEEGMQDKQTDIVDDETHHSRKRKKKKHKRSVDASPGNENNEEILANYVEEEVMEEKQTDIEDQETHHSRKRKKKKHKRSVDASPGNENKNNNEESLAYYLEEEVMEEKQIDIGEEETHHSRKRKKKKHEQSVDVSPGNENENNNEESSANYVEEEVMEGEHTDVEVEETRHSRKRKKKKHKRSVDASPGNENKDDNEESLANYVEEEVVEDKQTDIGDDETHHSRKKKKKKHKRSADTSPVNENKNNNEESLANYVEEEGMEDKQTDIGDDETHHSRKKKKKKHKRSADTSPVNENKNNNEESLANYVEEEVMEDKQTDIGDDETHRSRIRKKKKHKRSVDASPGNENKDDNEDSLANYVGEEVMEDKQTDVEVEETHHSRKSKKKKHKRSVDASPVNENKNNNEESSAYYVEEEGMQDKQTDIEDQETHHSRKSKKKKHKRSVDASPGNENKNNNEESLAYYVEEEGMQDKQTDIVDDETHHSRKKKKKKHKSSINNNNQGENDEVDTGSHNNGEIKVAAFDLGEENVLDQESIVENGTRFPRKKKKKKRKHSVDNSQRQDDVVPDGVKFEGDGDICEKVSENECVETAVEGGRSLSDTEPECAKETTPQESIIEKNSVNLEPSNNNKELNKEDNMLKDQLQSRYDQLNDFEGKQNIDETTYKILCENTEEICDGNDNSLCSEDRLVIDETASSGDNEVTLEHVTADSSTVGVKSDLIDSDDTCIDGDTSKNSAGTPTVVDKNLEKNTFGDERSKEDRCIIKLECAPHMPPKVLTNINNEEFVQKWTFASKGFIENGEAWRNLTAPMADSWVYECNINNEKIVQRAILDSFFKDGWKKNLELLNKQHRASIHSSTAIDTDEDTDGVTDEDESNSKLFLPAEIDEVIEI